MVIHHPPSSAIASYRPSVKSNESIAVPEHWESPLLETLISEANMLSRSIRSIVQASLTLLFFQPTTSWVLIPSPDFCSTRRSGPYRASPQVLLTATSPQGGSGSTDAEINDEDWIYDSDTEIVNDDEFDEGDETDWIPDSIMAEGRRKSKHLTPAKEVIKTPPEDDINSAGATTETKKGPSPYTEEEEELIASMGGKSKEKARREDGFLGDSTLSDIATDYSVPICYLADVLCMWGVPVPINVNDRLGDLVTGEQAFALVEAVNTLDVGALQDRYSNSNLMQLCVDWDMELKDVFEFAMKEGWTLPFGVRTNLRVEQEEEVLRVFSSLYDA